MARSDFSTKQPKKEVLYADFLNNLDPHPQSGDLVKSTNERSVARSMKNLLLTDAFERPFQPSIRSNIKKILFEPMDDISAKQLKDAVHDVLKKHEPRVRVLDIIVTPYIDQGMYLVDIQYYLINSVTPISTTITFKRVR